MSLYCLIIGSERVCDPQEWAECHTPTIENYVINDLQSECACAPQCELDVYTHDFSMAPFSENAIRYMAALENSSLRIVQHDFAAVTIFFSRIGYEETKTEKAYGVVHLLCDIGGALGLVLGSTLLTLCEFADFGLTQIFLSMRNNKK